MTVFWCRFSSSLLQVWYLQGNRCGMYKSTIQNPATIQMLAKYLFSTFLQASRDEVLNYPIPYILSLKIQCTQLTCPTENTHNLSYPLAIILLHVAKKNAPSKGWTLIANLPLLILVAHRRGALKQGMNANLLQYTLFIPDQNICMGGD